MRCPQKRKFPSNEAAVRFAAKIVCRKKNTKTAYLRIYECPHCGSWHLTKQAPRKSLMSKTAAAKDKAA
jgi:DNA-directed RNA polymerase subunit RPC12/RpoP